MTNIRINNPSISGLGLFVCLIALLAVSFSIGLRIEPSIMQNEMLRIFHFSPSTLDALVVRYQYSLIATLLFAGLAVDYFGPRTVLVSAIVVALIGNYIFGTATTVSTMINGRVILGYAHPFILISAIKLGTLWLPKRYFACFVGLLFATLLMTPVIVKPTIIGVASKLGIATFTQLFDIIGIVLIVALAFTKKHQSVNGANDRVKFKDIIAVLMNSKIWLICIISCLGWMANTFLLNYGAFFLVKNLHYYPHLASETINTAFVYFALGAVIMSILAEFLHEKRLLIAIGYIFAAITFSLVLYVPHLSLVTTSSLLFAADFFAGSAVICYAKAYDICTTPANAGSTFALIAFITTLGNVLFTLLVGKLLQTSQVAFMSNPLTWHALLAFISCALLLGALLTLQLRKK